MKHMNLEETVQYLLDCIETGVRIEYYFTDRAALESMAHASNVGKYYLLKEGDEPIHLFIVVIFEGIPTLQDLGEWPKPGRQGVPGQMGDTPEIGISRAGTWVINGIDTGKPSRGVQGEMGRSGIQGLPGAGVGTLNDIDGTDYQPDLTEGVTFDLVTTAVKVKYIMDDTPAEQLVTLKYYVPHNMLKDVITIENGEVRFLDPVRAPKMAVPTFAALEDGQGHTVEGTFAKQTELASKVSYNDRGGIQLATDYTPERPNELVPKAYVDEHSGGGGVIYMHRLIWLKDPEQSANPDGDVELDIYVPNWPNPITLGSKQEVSMLLESAIATPTVTFTVSGEVETTYNQYATMFRNAQTVSSTGYLDTEPEIYALSPGGTTVNALRRQINLWNTNLYAFYEDTVLAVNLE